jgi:hypothetical protein
MSDLDNDKNQENIIVNNIFSNPVPGENGLVLDITNAGTKTVRLMHVGIENNDRTNPYVQYQFVDLRNQTKYGVIESGHPGLYVIHDVSFNQDGNYLMKVITEKGSIFTILYRDGLIFNIPTITLSPNSGAQGQNVIISGVNFVPYADIQIRFETITLFPTESVHITTSPNGSFSTLITVPSGFSPNPLPYTISAQNTTQIATAPFTITPPP